MQKLHFICIYSIFFSHSVPQSRRGFAQLKRQISRKTDIDTLETGVRLKANKEVQPILFFSLLICKRYVNSAHNKRLHFAIYIIKYTKCENMDSIEN